MTRKFTGTNYALLTITTIETRCKSVDVSDEQEYNELQQSKSLELMTSFGHYSLLKAKTPLNTTEYYHMGNMGSVFDGKPDDKAVKKFTLTTDLDLTTVKFVSTGYNFTMFVTETQSVMNIPSPEKVIDHRMLHTNKLIDVKASYNETYFLFDNNQCLKLNAVDEFEDSVLEDIVSVHPGGFFALFIKKDGFIYGHGEGKSGEFAHVTSGEKLVKSRFENQNVERALIPATSKVKAIVSNWHQTLVLTQHSKLFTCGLNISTRFTELEFPDVLGIIKICSIYYHFMVLTDDHKVYIGNNHGLKPLVWDREITQEPRGLVPIDIGNSYIKGYVLLGHPASSNESQERSKRLWRALENASFIDVIIHASGVVQ